jgi:hypothetical protein
VKTIGEKATLTLRADVPAEQDPQLDIDAEGAVDRLHKQVPELDDAAAEKGPRGNWRSLFSLDYLSDIAKVVQSAKATPAALKVELGNDNPVRFSITLMPGVNVTYLLAPRIEAE